MMYRTALGVSWIVLWTGVLTGCQAKLDHFKVWDVDPLPAEKVVNVKGEFDNEAKELRVEKLVAFANPVEKNGAAVSDENSHLTWYLLSEARPRRIVQFWNQFGHQRWTLGDAVRLLLPAEKKVPGLFSPTRVEHFVCYEVSFEEALGIPLALSDSFDRMRQITETVRLHPAFYCVPVEINGERVRNRKSHLAVYHLKPQTLLDPPIDSIHVEDQFAKNTLTVRKSMYLAAPTKKLGSRELP